MGYRVQQSTTAYALVFGPVVQSADHISAGTGLTLTVTLSKNGAAFGAPAGAVTEIANGFYKVAGNATDNNTLGGLALHATGAGADPFDDMFEVVIDDLTTKAARPTDKIGLDLTNVGLYAAGPFPTTGIIDSGTAQGSADTSHLQIRAAASFADHELKGALLVIRSATTGALQRRIVTDNVGSTDTLTFDPLDTALTGSIVYDIFGQAPGSTGSPVPCNATQVAGTAQTTGADLGTIAPAIKTKTDGLNFHGVNVKADVKELNDVTLNGDGTGTPWGP